MKKYYLVLVFLFLGLAGFSQEHYKYVIIPTQFESIGSGFNPYQVCSEAQKVLLSKHIKSVFESNDRPDDFQQALTLVLKKASSLLRNKLEVELRNCYGNLVWHKEGVGFSKDFRQGYAEALQDAFKDLKELPVNTVNEDAHAPVVAQPDDAPQQVVAADVNAKHYVPKNLFSNHDYDVDVIDGKDGNKLLVIVHGEKLGYKDLQNIGVLKPSGLDGMYNLVWFSPSGTKFQGLANLTDSKLDLSFKTAQGQTTIQLKK